MMIRPTMSQPLAMIHLPVPMTLKSHAEAAPREVVTWTPARMVRTSRSTVSGMDLAPPGVMFRDPAREASTRKNRADMANGGDRWRYFPRLRSIRWKPCQLMEFLIWDDMSSNRYADFGVIRGMLMQHGFDGSKLDDGDRIANVVVTFAGAESGALWRVLDLTDGHFRSYVL